MGHRRPLGGAARLDGRHRLQAVARGERARRSTCGPRVRPTTCSARRGDGPERSAAAATCRWRRARCGSAPPWARTPASTSTGCCSARLPAVARSTKLCRAGVSSAPPAVTVVSEGRVSYKLQVDDASAPFWLVLGQSQNDGWKATVKGGGSLGTPTLIDGYANGWYITPTGSGPIEITLSWTPQKRRSGSRSGSRRSALAVLPRACSRWRGLAADAGRVAEDARVPRSRRGAPTVAQRLRLPLSTRRDRSRGSSSGSSRGPSSADSPRSRSLAGLLWPNVRPVGDRVGARSARAAPRLFIIVKQWRYSLEPSFDWPTFFDKVHVLGWIGVSTLVADLVARVVREWLQLQPVMNRSPQSCPLPFHRRRVVRSTRDVRGDARRRDDRASRRR